MSKEFLRTINGSAAGLLSDYISALRKEPRIAYYPSAGDDFRPLIYLRPEFNAGSPAVKPEPVPPDLFVFTDYMRHPIPEEGAMLHDDGRTRIMVMVKEDLNPLPLRNDPEVVVASDRIGGKASFLYANVSSSAYEEDLLVPLIYVQVENEAFCSKVLLPSGAKVSHIIRIRYGYPSGLGKANGGWIDNVLGRLGTEMFIKDPHDGMSFGDDAALRIYPNLRRLGREEISLETIRNLDAKAWSGHGDVSWNLVRVGKAVRNAEYEDEGRNRWGGDLMENLEERTSRMTTIDEGNEDLEVARAVGKLLSNLKRDIKLGEMRRRGMLPDEILEDEIGHTISMRSKTNAGDFNLYPSLNKASCCPVAYFVVTDGMFRKGLLPRRWGDMDLRFDEALEKIIQHMQGTCAGITRKAVLITPEWSAEHFHRWEANLRRIRNEGELKVFLTHGGDASEIRL